MRRIQKASLAAAGVLLLAAPAASAQDSVDSGPLTDGVKLRGLVEHQLNLQNIADFGTGTRATGTPGYEASVDYVETRLERAGYNVRREPFNFPTWQENSPPVLRFGGTTYEPGTAADDDSPDVDFITFEFSGSGDLTGVPVVPTTDVQVNPNPGGSTSGCEDADFPAATEGAVSLVQRGTCGFAQKLANAEQAGAVGVILFNEGNGTGRSNALYRTAPVDFPIPAVLSSYAVGVALSTAYAAGQNPTVDLSVDATSTPRYFDNVIAESRTGDPRKKVMLGAHLDSVPAGPGINDNGSGTAALLEIAEEMSKLTRGRANRLTNQVAFAFWGAEESGLIGSTDFVKNLSPGQKARILANLNFDMLGSPNYARFIYDGDGDAFGTTGPPGSDAIEALFEGWFASEGLASEPTAFDGRSDYGPFIEAGIPAGGLFTGAEGVKTEAQVALYGGDAGSWFDPCYHQACDTLDTVLGKPPADADGLPDPAGANAMRGGGAEALDQMADAAAHTTWVMAKTENPLGTAPATVARRQAAAGKVDLRFRGPKRVQR